MASSAGTCCATDTDLSHAIEVKHHLIQHLVELTAGISNFIMCLRLCRVSFYRHTQTDCLLSITK